MSEPSGLDPEKRARLRMVGELDQFIAAALTALRAARAELGQMQIELADLKRDLQALEQDEANAANE